MTLKGVFCWKKTFWLSCFIQDKFGTATTRIVLHLNISGLKWEKAKEIKLSIIVEEKNEIFEK